MVPQPIARWSFVREPGSKLKRHLILADGTIFTGTAFGSELDACGEIVFNTGMTGYQEILTDPSYAGQIVLFTYPLIGNYGINDDDFESDKPQPVGIIVREACEIPSNWRSRKSLDRYLEEQGIPGICEIDTRAVTKKIRNAGVTMAILSNKSVDEALNILRNQPSYDERNFVSEVSTPFPYAWGYEGKELIDAPTADYKFKIAVIDCGLKFNILRRLAALNCRSLVFPQSVTAEELMGWKPDGVLLSPGPGDPKHLNSVIQTAGNLIGKIPIFGICLGNQILAHAVGATTYKLKFGHRGSNHPVKDLITNKVHSTTQNHGSAVSKESLIGTGAEITQINLNDETIEGIELKTKRAFSIQYHPEAAPGPWDSRLYFERFLEMIGAAGS